MRYIRQRKARLDKYRMFYQVSFWPTVHFYSLDQLYRVAFSYMSTNGNDDYLLLDLCKCDLWKPQVMVDLVTQRYASCSYGCTVLTYVQVVKFSGELKHILTSLANIHLIQAAISKYAIESTHLYTLSCPPTLTIASQKLSHLTHTPPRTAVCINMYVCRLVTLLHWSWLQQCSTKGITHTAASFSDDT